MWFRFVASTFRRLLHLLQAGPKRFVYNRFEGCAQFGRNGPRAFQNIVIYIKCRPHSVMIASFKMMSTHHLHLLSLFSVTIFPPRFPID